MDRIAVFISGRGSLLPPICRDIERGILTARICCVISDRPQAVGVEKASSYGLPVVCLDRRKYRDPDGITLSDALLEEVSQRNADLIVLAGFLSILEGRILEEYAGRILNIHPSLLPRHGGRGMYGKKVHQAVIDSNESYSGCTVHYVTAGVDTGPTILQREIEVLPGETPESLQARVHEIEGDTLVEALGIALRSPAAVMGVGQ